MRSRLRPHADVRPLLLSTLAVALSQPTACVGAAAAWFDPQHRRRAAQAYPPPDAPPMATPSLTTSATRTVAEALTYRALGECTGGGRPGTADGEDQVPPALAGRRAAHASAPSHAAPTPDGDGRCTTYVCATNDHWTGSACDWHSRAAPAGAP